MLVEELWDLFHHIAVPLTVDSLDAGQLLSRCNGRSPRRFSPMVDAGRIRRQSFHALLLQTRRGCSWCLQARRSTCCRLQSSAHRSDNIEARASDFDKFYKSATNLYSHGRHEFGSQVRKEGVSWVVSVASSRTGLGFWGPLVVS